jgi:hypothetical protein
MYKSKTRESSPNNFILPSLNGRTLKLVNEINRHHYHQVEHRISNQNISDIIGANEFKNIKHLQSNKQKTYSRMK